MAIDPATAKLLAKVAISQITDEESRKNLIIGIVVGVIILVLLIFLPVYLILQPIEQIKNFFGISEEEVINQNILEIEKLKNNYGSNLESAELIFNGILPLPVNGVVTSEFGNRLHPITQKYTLHSGIDLAGKHRENIISVLDGKVVFAGIKGGYGNCIQIEHTFDGETIYTLYGHLARIDVVKNQEVKQGDIIGTQGGDPNLDPNPRIFNR